MGGGVWKSDVSMHAWGGSWVALIFVFWVRFVLGVCFGLFVIENWVEIGTDFIYISIATVINYLMYFYNSGSPIVF